MLGLAFGVFSMSFACITFYSHCQGTCISDPKKDVMPIWTFLIWVVSLVMLIVNLINYAMI